MKVCFVCSKHKELSGFYKDSRMNDGHLGKCKECCKQQATQRRQDNLEKVRAYDRKRNMLPHRVVARAVYAKTEQGKVARIRGNKAWRQRNPEKKKAHFAVSNALRDGHLIRPNWCECCGERHPLQGHHEDYSKPLEVQWLCCACHIVLHGKGVLV